MPNYKNQSGVLLLLALVMTTVVLSGALILATLIIRESRVSQISDKGQIALYATESIAEDTIYEILQNGTDPITLDGSSGSFSTGATWSREVSTETNEFIYDYIPSDRSEVVNLYHKDKDNSQAELTSVDLNWSSGTLLQVDAYIWDGAALSDLTSLQTFSCSGGCTASVPLDPTKAYSLIFTAAGSAVSKAEP